MKKHRTTLPFLAILSLLFLAGCTSLDYIAVSAGGSTGGGGGGAPMREIGKPANNSTVSLDAGRYRGGITVSANKVTIVGAGTGRTLIVGDLRITGNNCTVRGLRIQGDVIITGNNADLSGAAIEGRVSSSGNNNRW